MYFTCPKLGRCANFPQSEFNASFANWNYKKYYRKEEKEREKKKHVLNINLPTSLLPGFLSTFEGSIVIPFRSKTS
jgi:hypothetical protein